jgi:uncharacterized FlaG/YvyC family protein
MLLKGNGGVVDQVQPSESVAPESSLKMKRETDDENNTVYCLVDSKTGTVISQVPSKQVLNVAQSIEDSDPSGDAQTIN